MNGLSILKSVVDFAVSAGVGSIVGSAARSTLNTNPNIYRRITIGIGAAVLSNMVSDHATKYTNEKIDTAVAKIQEVVVVVDAAVKEAEREI